MSPCAHSHVKLVFPFLLMRIFIFSCIPSKIVLDLHGVRIRMVKMNKAKNFYKVLWIFLPAIIIDLSYVAPSSIILPANKTKYKFNKIKVFC